MNKIKYELLRLEIYINQQVDDKLTRDILLQELNIVRTNLLAGK